MIIGCFVGGCDLSWFCYVALCIVTGFCKTNIIMIALLLCLNCVFAIVGVSVLSTQ